MKILLLTDMAPCLNHTSGLVINKWCDFLLEEGIDIYCALIKNKYIEMKIPQDKIEKVKFLEFEKPNEYWVSESKYFNNIKSKIKSYKENTKSAKKILPEMAKKIANYIKENDIDLIFASIQGQSMTKIVRDVSRYSEREYVAQTWDPLEWWMKESKFDIITYKSNLKEFKKVVQQSKNFMAMSWAMAKTFEKEYRKKCLINIPSLPLTKFEAKHQNKSDEFIIAFSGQIYAKKEIEVLINSLKKMNWQCNGKRIVLRMYGPFFPNEYYADPNIEVKGLVKQETLLMELKDSDLVYCPYWFSKEYKRPCKLSFPGKLTTYLNSGVPVLVHGPEYASPVIFTKINKSGYIIDTDNEIKFIQRLKEIIENYDYNIAKNGWKAYETYLTDAQAKKNLLVALGLMDESVVEEFNSLKKFF